MVKIVTIGGGNGHSSILKGFYEYLKTSPHCPYESDAVSDLTPTLSCQKEREQNQTRRNGISAIADPLQLHFVSSSPLTGEGADSNLFSSLKGKKHKLGFDDFSIISIVSMSDDGRTTGLLMREIQQKLGIYMPPPGDIRKCSLALSSSKFKNFFAGIFENVMDFEGNISEYSINDMLSKCLENPKFDGYDKQSFMKNLHQFDGTFLNYYLPLNSAISGHKFGNVLMASIYYNFGDYNKMVDYLGAMLEIKGKILPVTTDKASIFAKLGNYELIETQDKISNVANYDSPVDEIKLLRDSKKAILGKGVEEAIENADFLIIGPGDLYTSIDANFLINGFTKLVQNAKGKKIYILNSNNKKGETTNYNEIDFIDFIQRRLDNKLDVVVANIKETHLTFEEKERFKNDISVKGGRYLFIDEKKKQEIKKKYPKLEFILGEYVDKKSLYKNNEKMIEDIVYYMRKNNLFC